MRGGALRVEGRTAGKRDMSLYAIRTAKGKAGSLFSFNLVIREADYEQSGETVVYVE